MNSKKIDELNMYERCLHFIIMQVEQDQWIRHEDYDTKENFIKYLKRNKVGTDSIGTNLRNKMYQKAIDAVYRIINDTEDVTINDKLEVMELVDMDYQDITGTYITTDANKFRECMEQAEYNAMENACLNIMDEFDRLMKEADVKYVEVERNLYDY